MDLYIASFGFGLVTASVLAISAVAFTMQFGITDVLNLAFGGVMISSAFIAYVINSAGVSIWIAMVAAGVSGAIISYLINRFVLMPFKRRNISQIGMVIVTLALGLILENLVLALAGPNNVSYALNNGPTLSVGSFELTALQVGTIALSVVIAGVIHALLTLTRLGKAMRATSCNPGLARASGIRTERVIASTWLITGALCGISGTAFAMNSGSFGPSSAELFLVVIIAAAFVGGVGQPYGAMLGALLLGIVTEVSAAFITPDYKEVIAFIILLAVMALRPQGLIARARA
ncbi:MAG TPA: branched-chain amino acid ABC transporter permease [Candidatus Micrarchaeia archaeon]|nr:branched-chain amino acid ABC transporter permease [Candidatus Micrarchaeia archaeon]